MKELVSICIPAYKQKELLQKCIESILIQDYENIELLISDDSPDNALEQVIAQLLNGKNYTYARNNPALGSPENWNAVIRKAKGKYIKIMHHDDYFTQKNSLSLLVQEIKRTKASLLFCATDVWHINENQHYRHFISKKQLALLEQKPELLFFKNCIGAPSATIYLKELNYEFDKRFKWLVDVDFYLLFLLAGKKIAALNEALVCTTHGAQGQITGQIIEDQATQIREHVLLYLKLKEAGADHADFSAFFDRLFFSFKVENLKQLIMLVPEAEKESEFFSAIFKNIGKFRKLKWLKKRFYESRYNNYIFKLEEFL